MDETPPEYFEPYIWDGDYDKIFYWVHLPDGTRVECWPNAGFMMSTDGSGRRWGPEDKPTVSVQRDEESRLYRPDKLREANERERADYEQRRGCAVALGSPAVLGENPAAWALAALARARQRGPAFDTPAALLVIDEAGAYDEGQMNRIAEILSQEEHWRRAKGNVELVRVSLEQPKYSKVKAHPAQWNWAGYPDATPGEKMIKERLRAKRARTKKRSKR